MVKNTCFLTSFEGHILAPDVRPGYIGPYNKICLDELLLNKYLNGLYIRNIVHENTSKNYGGTTKGLFCLTRKLKTFFYTRPFDPYIQHHMQKKRGKSTLI